MNEIAALNADVLASGEGPALSATSDAPKAQETTVVETDTTEEAAKPEKATPPEEVLAEPGEIDPKKLNKDALRERFSELTTKQKEALARAETAEAQLREYAAREETARREEQARRDGAPKPDRAAFDDPDAYDAALIEWSENKGKRAGMTEAQMTAQREANERSQVEARTAFNARMETFKTETPDFEAVAFADNVTISPVMAMNIQRMDNGPHVAYHLGKNPEIAAKIAAMTAPEQVFEMGKLSASVTTERRSNVSKAPPPISTIGSRSTATKRPEEMSGDEYYAYRQAERLAARS